MTTASNTALGAAPLLHEESVRPYCLLDDLPLRCPARVVRVTAPAGAPEWASWLSEIGFLPGERVVVLARGRPGGDPLVVRIGDSTFALRRAEAACIEVDTQTADADRGA